MVDNAKSNTLIKWNFIEFMVFKNDVMCSMSHVELISEQRSIYCGYYLPWDRHSKGSVTIIQQFITTLKTASYFKLFFHVEYDTLVENRADINMIIHITNVWLPVVTKSFILLDLSHIKH